MYQLETPYEMMPLNTSKLTIPEAYQRELRPDRVAHIVAEFDERIANEPKVSFRDGKYNVFDGMHTVVARKILNGRGDVPVLCKVYRGLTEDDEALLFAKQTGFSAPLTPSEKLHANLCGKQPAALAFVEATESAGLHIGFGRTTGTGRITCINTAFSEFLRVGAEIYTEALTVMRKAWDGNPNSLRADLIRGVVGFVELYHDEYIASRLIDRLRESPPSTLYKAALADQTLRGRKRFLNLIYRIYNGRDERNALRCGFEFQSSPTKDKRQESTPTGERGTDG